MWQLSEVAYRMRVSDLVSSGPLVLRCTLLALVKHKVRSLALLLNNGTLCYFR